MNNLLGIIALLLFFSVSCTPSAEDLVNEFFEFDEEEGECYHGNATLPPGNHPEYLITPEGYRFRCDDRSSIRFHSDGTMWFTLSSEDYSELLEYWHDCGGHPGSPHLGQTGEWIIDETGRLCLQRNNIQPGLYVCGEITYESGTLDTTSECADFYDSDGDYLGRECDDDEYTCTLIEE